MRHAAVAVAVIVIGLPLAILLLLEPASECGSTSSPVSAPPPGTQTAGQVVRYLESQGFTPFGAAGIVGNLQQESTSTLDPTLSDGAGGGGIAQWKASWYAQMASWATGHGLSPTSLAGQLAYLAWDVRTSYPQLVSELNSASSPQEAATMFETTYEMCSGYVAYMVVIPGSPCNDPARRDVRGAGVRRSGRPVRDGSTRVAEHGQHLLSERLVGPHRQRPTGVAAAAGQRDAAGLLEL